jgi:phosphoribosyl 1,2-cyclic phosphodiesterase
MSIRFCVLGSGSGGNAALLVTPHAQVLVDIGFTPAELSVRLAVAGSAWGRIGAVLLTHTHTDHVKTSVLGELARRSIPLYCHAEHLTQLAGGRNFEQLSAAGLLHPFHGAGSFELAEGLRAWPLRLPHDRPPTFGYRFEAGGTDGRVRRLAYVADCGHWPKGLTEELRGLDLLALEFNHDEEMEWASGRPDFLIERVLGPHGHLSNRQAAAALEEIIRADGNGGPRRLVQLHLSEDCNEPGLAHQAAQAVLKRLSAGTEVFTTRQDAPGRVHLLE